MKELWAEGYVIRRRLVGCELACPFEAFAHLSDNTGAFIGELGTSEYYKTADEGFAEIARLCEQLGIHLEKTS